MPVCCWAAFLSFFPFLSFSLGLTSNQKPVTGHKQTKTNLNIGPGNERTEADSDIDIDTDKDTAGESGFVVVLIVGGVVAQLEKENQTQKKERRKMDQIEVR